MSKSYRDGTCYERHRRGKDGVPSAEVLDAGATGYAAEQRAQRHHRAYPHTLKANRSLNDIARVGIQVLGRELIRHGNNARKICTHGDRRAAFEYK